MTVRTAESWQFHSDDGHGIRRSEFGGATGQQPGALADEKVSNVPVDYAAFVPRSQIATNPASPMPNNVSVPGSGMLLT